MTFYVRFLGSSEEVKEKFAGTDFELQQHRLASSLRILAHAMTGEKDALHILSERAESHNREHMHIRPELYVLWRELLIYTAAETDPEWNEDIATSWEQITEHAVTYMTKRF